MKEVTVLPDPQKAIEQAFLDPISSPPLEEIIRKKGKPPEKMSVAIAVSDITRPVPYKGESGILPPLLGRLESQGSKRKYQDYCGHRDASSKHPRREGGDVWEGSGGTVYDLHQVGE